MTNMLIKVSLASGIKMCNLRVCTYGNTCIIILRKIVYAAQLNIFTYEKTHPKFIYVCMLIVSHVE